MRLGLGDDQLGRLSEQLHRIRDMGESDEALRTHHHFLFALPTPNFDHERPVDLILIGLNPGETANCRRIAPGYRHEESFEIDFHANAGSAVTGRRRWLRNIEKTLPWSNVLMSELFFWSSPGAKQLEDVYGSVRNIPYLDFCCELNRELIEIVSPRAVVFTGLSWERLVVERFDLRKRRDLFRDGSSDMRLVESYSSAGRPWFVIPHLSGARKFSDEKRKQVSEFIRLETDGATAHTLPD